MIDLPVDYTSFFEANKDGWNKRTAVHKSSAFYDVNSFKKGKSSLQKTELDALGDVTNKSILHLQCHFGLDTLSLARMGAKVTGIDLSNNAIEYAKELSAELHIPANFICCNVYDLKDYLQQPYDIIFTSYGVIGWLPDLQKWAEIIHDYLKPEGIFYMVEFHPVVWMMDENFEKIKYYYHNEETIVIESKGTYTDRDAPIEYVEYSWNHSLSEVVNSLIGGGLTIQSLDEYPFSHFNCFNNMEANGEGCWTIKRIKNKLPMMYSIKACKQ